MLEWPVKTTRQGQCSTPNICLSLPIYCPCFWPLPFPPHQEAIDASSRSPVSVLLSFSNMDICFCRDWAEEAQACKLWVLFLTGCKYSVWTKSPSAHMAHIWNGLTCQAFQLLPFSTGLPSPLLRKEASSSKQDFSLVHFNQQWFNNNIYPRDLVLK